jgi:hypothetical protein
MNPTNCDICGGALPVPSHTGGTGYGIAIDAETESEEN